MENIKLCSKCGYHTLETDITQCPICAQSSQMIDVQTENLGVLYNIIERSQDYSAALAAAAKATVRADLLAKSANLSNGDTVSQEKFDQAINLAGMLADIVRAESQTHKLDFAIENWPLVIQLTNTLGFTLDPLVVEEAEPVYDAEVVNANVESTESAEENVEDEQA